MAVGRELKGERNNVVVVIGDGAMTTGQAYETMNNVRYLDSDMIVILNDNKQVSLPTTNLGGPIPHVGALSSAFSRLQLNRPLRELREVAKGVTKQIGGSMHELAAKVDEFARGMISGRQLSLVLVKDWVFPVVKVSSSLWPLQRNCNFLAPQSGHPISGDCVVFRRVFHLIMATLKQPLIHTY